MNENLMNARRIENYKEYIKNILSNRDIDCDEPWWESPGASAALKRLVQAKRWEISDSREMEIENSENFIFLKYITGHDRKALLTELTEKACELVKEPESAGKALYIICIVDNMRSRVFLEKTFLSGEGKVMKKTIRRKMSGKSAAVNFLYILDNCYAEQDIKLVNINRFDFIQMPPMNPLINLEGGSSWNSRKDQEGRSGWDDRKTPENSNRGYVTSAPLCQLIDIYNKIGDKLFKRNVRYGLNEQLGVDRAIKETLRNSPQDFWFKNNGITLLVERPDFKLDRVGEVLLEHITEYGSLNFSVINGAQTITASAQCLYEMEYELEELQNKDDREEAQALREQIKRSRDAMVLLRIIHIPLKIQNPHSETGSTREVNEISVALNRQKPIKAEDIAFASPFVEKLAAFLEREQINGKRYFKLVKRGESNITNHSVDLVDFARARKACAGFPGDARSKGTNALLSSKYEIGGEYCFNDTTIFVPEWLEAEEEQEADIFKKYYGAVNFAILAANFYGKKVKEFQEENTAQLTVLQNGKWYFTAYLVQLFNGFQDDFSQFTDCFELIRGKLADLMKLFADQCAALAYSSGKFKILDSNTFKKEELYRLVIEKADPRLFVELINRDLEPEDQIEFYGHANGSADAAVTGPAGGTIQAAGKAKFIKLNGGPNERVNSTAHAMVKTVQFVLDNYCGHEEELLITAWDWFTDDKKRVEEGYGYLRRAVEVTGHDGKTYWVGTHSNTNVKYNQIKDLCRIAGVKRNHILWLAADMDTTLFAW